MTRKFVFDDLHIAVNRHPQRDAYRIWMIFDASCGLPITMLAMISLIRTGKFPVFAITALVVFAYTVWTHFKLAQDYKRLDEKVIRIYQARAEADYYDIEWYGKYKKAMDAYQNQDGEPPFSYLVEYERATDSFLVARLIVVIIVIVVSFAAGISHPFTGILAGFLHAALASFSYRAMLLILEGSFSSACIDELFGMPH